MVKAIRKKFFMFVGIFSLFILAGAAYSYFIGNKKEETPCLNSMQVFIRLDTSAIPNRLVVMDSAGNVHRPILESENIVLTEGDSLEICYTLIDSSNFSHRLIHINKAVPVHLQDEDSE